MRTQYKLIPTSGEPMIQEVDWPLDPGLALISGLIRPLLNGGDLERVRVWHTNEYLDMFVDERGISKQLPVNAIATMIYRSNALTFQKPTPRAEDLSAIYGPAVLFMRRIWS
jgi:hypothetical protein